MSLEIYNIGNNVIYNNRNHIIFALVDDKYALLPLYINDIKQEIIYVDIEDINDDDFFDCNNNFSVLQLLTEKEYYDLYNRLYSECTMYNTTDYHIIKDDFFVHTFTSEYNDYNEGDFNSSLKHNTNVYMLTDIIGSASDGIVHLKEVSSNNCSFHHIAELSDNEYNLIKYDGSIKSLYNFVLKRNIEHFDKDILSKYVDSNHIKIFSYCDKIKFKFEHGAINVQEFVQDMKSIDVDIYMIV